MTTDLCTEDVVVCIASPQMMTPVSGAGGTCGSRVAQSSAAVELGRRLLLAARAGHTDVVLDLMAKGAPFTTDWLGTSPLHLSAAHAHADTCAVLLRAGVSRDARTKVDRTPLHLAAYAGHADVVAVLLDHGAAVDCQDMLRMTPLHWAAQRGHADVARLLLARGCSVAPRSKFHKTPRELAARAGHAALVTLIDSTARQRDAERPHTVPPEPPSPRRPRARPDDVPADTQLPAQEFLTIPRIQEVKPNAKTKVQQESPTKSDPKTESTNNGGSDSRAAALLRRHGITLLPADDGSTVLSALQSGRTVVLSDAGKLMLKESSAPQVSLPTATPTLSTAGAQSPSKGLKLFTLNNKLLLPPKTNKTLSNVQVSQVKFVQLPEPAPPSPSPVVPPSPVIPPVAPPGERARKRAAGKPVKIIVNKSNYKLLGRLHGDSQTIEPVESPTITIDDDDNESLRSQLQAARKAIAALTAELASCKARLAQLEERQT